MKMINIHNSDEYRIEAWKLNEENDNQIIINLLDDVEHTHSIRFAEKKLVLITCAKQNSINYTVELSSIWHRENYRDYCNETSFYFGGNSDSLYLFSNLKIIPSCLKLKNHSNELKQINPDEQECKKYIFMMINHDTKITFLNCYFHNNTEHKLIIETWHNAVIEFINCQFIGEFTFKSNHESVIIRN